MKGRIQTSKVSTSPPYHGCAQPRRQFDILADPNSSLNSTAGSATHNQKQLHPGLFALAGLLARQAAKDFLLTIGQSAPPVLPRRDTPLLNKKGITDDTQQ